MSTPVLQLRAAKAVAVRRGDERAAEEATRDLAAAKLEQYASRVLAAAPPLTAAQVDRIVTVLRGAL